MIFIVFVIYIKNKNVIFKLVIFIVVFGVLGVVFGLLLVNYLFLDILKKIFGIFLFLVGLFEVKKGFCVKFDKKLLN